MSLGGKFWAEKIAHSTHLKRTLKKFRNRAKTKTQIVLTASISDGVMSKNMALQAYIQIQDLF